MASVKRRPYAVEGSLPTEKFFDCNSDTAVKAAWRLLRRALFLLQRRIDRRIGADLVVRTLRPSRHREIRGIDSRNPALPHHNLAENIAIHGHDRTEQLVIPFIRGSQ